MKTQDNQHFSHEHILIPLTLNQDHEKLYCYACEQQIFDPSYNGCIQCNYYLHDQCLNFPRSLEHPSHPSHPLTLLPAPTYASRSFSCEACAFAGNSFSMSCAHCEFDLHLNCASLPNSLLRPNKHPHKLKLIFAIPLQGQNSVFVCDVCNSKMHQTEWCYYCDDCDFGAHLHCAVPERFSRKNGGGSGPRGERNRGRTTIPEVDTIRQVSEAQEKLAAAQLEARIRARGEEAALSLLDPPGTKYYYY